MKKNNFVLGGEPSGHIILSNMSSSGDGLLASLEVLYTLKESKKKLIFLYQPLQTNTSNYSEAFVVSKNNTAEKILKNSKPEIYN